MTLQRCRECGRHVSTRARACPGCGISKPTRGRGSGASGAARILFLLLLVAGATGAGMAVRLYEESRPVESLRPSTVSTRFASLSVELARSGSTIIVTNRDDHTWTDCVMDINAGVRGGSFSKALGDVATGERVSAGLRTFARADGREFDPGAESVQVVDLHCDTPDGAAHFSGRP